MYYALLVVQGHALLSIEGHTPIPSVFWRFLIISSEIFQRLGCDRTPSPQRGTPEYMGTQQESQKALENVRRLKGGACAPQHDMTL